MSARTRGLLFVPIGAALLAGLIAACTGLPDFGHGGSAFGAWVLEHAGTVRATTDVVAPVTFDLRALDTLGEEFILFAAASACVLLLRRVRPRDEEARLDDVTTLEAAPIRALGAGLVAPLVVLGAYVISHGHVTPGGGFQGGVIVAALTLLIFATGRVRAARRSHPVPVLEGLEAFGAGAFALIGIGGLVFAAAAFQNFLGKGVSGDLVSGGTIPLLNVAVGIEVAAAFTLITVALLDQLLPGSAES